jgi:hypothetical protein
MPYHGRCHCGAIQFEVDSLPDELTDCNCSFCIRRGGLLGYYKPAQFRLKTARERVATYQCADYIGQHHHCAICGISAYSEFPSYESGEADYGDLRYVVNLRLLDDPVWESLPVRKVNGRENP